MKTIFRFDRFRDIWSSPKERRNLRNGLLFISPWLIGLLGFTLYPIFASFYWSFCLFDGFSKPVWVGLGNYRMLLFEDPLFWKALFNTLYMVIFALPVSLIFSLALALLLNLKVKGQPIYRTILYLPSIAPVIAVPSLSWICTVPAACRVPTRAWHLAIFVALLASSCKVAGVEPWEIGMKVKVQFNPKASPSAASTRDLERSSRREVRPLP